MNQPTPEAESIVDLAETVKELVRLLKCQAALGKLAAEFNPRLDAVYKKASVAKGRVELEYK